MNKMLKKLIFTQLTRLCCENSEIQILQQKFLPKYLKKTNPLNIFQYKLSFFPSKIISLAFYLNSNENPSIQFLLRFITKTKTKTPPNKTRSP